MKTIRQLTLTVITALFVVTAALLWTSASPKVTGQTTPTFAVAPQAATGLAPYGGALAFLDGLFKRPGEDSTPEFSVMVSARNHLLWAISMETDTSIFWSATAFLVRRAFLF
jgi:hypothetical protein